MKKLLMLIIILILFISTGSAYAEDPSTTYLGGEWNNPNSWTDGVPDLETVVYFPTSGHFLDEICFARKVVITGETTSVGLGNSVLIVQEKITMEKDTLLITFVLSVISTPRIESADISCGGVVILNDSTLHVNYFNGYLVLAGNSYIAPYGPE